MRRAFAIFMLVLLPLLASWSAVAAYCGDESPSLAKHPGHHVDKHHSDGQADSQNGQAAPAADADCDHCHSPGAVRAGVADRASPAALRSSTRWIQVTLRAPPPSLPERPKWARFA